MRGSKLQIRCRLILLISDHPIQRGIRKECRTPSLEIGTPSLEIWTLSEKTAVSGSKTKKMLPKFFLRLRDTHKKYILPKKMLENRPEDALGLLVETVETVKTGINLLTNRDVVWKNQATCPRPKAEDR